MLRILNGHPPFFVRKKTRDPRHQIYIAALSFFLKKTLPDPNLFSCPREYFLQEYFLWISMRSSRDTASDVVRFIFKNKNWISDWQCTKLRASKRF